ncbi:SETD3 family histone-lysine N-methyltransferase [bacterium]|nr:SETD3 family histone-lysine N-methyltransferase [bacterium]
MGSSIAEDEALLKSGEAKDRARVAVEYRLGKKKILQMAVKKYS